MALPHYAPMLAAPGSPPPPSQDDAWGVEMKWDGVRALAYVEDGAVRLMSRNLKDITIAYPEIQLMAGAVGGHAVVLDGELVAFDDAGRPSFGQLQARMHQRNRARITELVGTVPVTYLIFDLLHVNTASATAMPYVERRELLEATVRPGYRWQVPTWFRGGAQAALESSEQLGLEGVVCKRLASPYRPGRRSADWTKVKNWHAAEVIIGGWQPGAGRRSGAIGSLLLGAHDRQGRLVYVGHVGTGFTATTLRSLRERLAPLEQEASPFTSPVPREFARTARWVEPVLVGEVRYGEWTADHRLRHPSWRGLRADVEPSAVLEPGLRDVS
ncbi:non-homologous end-joining DNA ligase [Nonomuraea sp. NPDC050394]|uniref:non-homologous end-joining DNA ligase n=1 Tax=Nonomuraea sp. NPDC050394 TaxID=3364363 RepID=UPI0037AAEFD2